MLNDVIVALATAPMESAIGVIRVSGEDSFILLDIGEYKEEKYEKLIQMARKYAKEVQQTKGKVTLKPMPSDERRIIHGALTNYHNIKTESVGQGKDRRLTIYYVEE